MILWFRVHFIWTLNNYYKQPNEPKYNNKNNDTHREMQKSLSRTSKCLSIAYTYCPISQSDVKQSDKIASDNNSFIINITLMHNMICQFFPAMKFPIRMVLWMSWLMKAGSFFFLLVVLFANEWKMSWI